MVASVCGGVSEESINLKAALSLDDRYYFISQLRNYPFANHIPQGNKYN